MPLVDDLLPGGTRQSESPLADARGSVKQRPRKIDRVNVADARRVLGVLCG